MSAAKLELIEKKLEKIENWCEKHDSADEARDSIDELPSPLHTWDTRVEYFDSISSELISVSQTGETEEVLSTASKLQGKVEKSEHVLNVLVNDDQIPANESEAAARYVVDVKELIRSASIQEGLIDWAIYHLDPAVRRSAWLSICRGHAQNPPPANGGGFHKKFERNRLKELRQKFMAERAVLGPRGSVLTPAKNRPEAGELATDLLEILANPEGADRRELALTLGEIGGPEVAQMLADALRAELEEQGTDEAYQSYLATALGKLGGSDAVDALLRAAKNGSETVRLSSLSALESLATGGYVALTEYPETVTIDSDQMRDAYLNLADELAAVISSAEDMPYVRHKAEDLLDNVQTSLETVRVIA
jgi:HEAT repeat protein